MMKCAASSAREKIAHLPLLHLLLNLLHLLPNLLLHLLPNLLLPNLLLLLLPVMTVPSHHRNGYAPTTRTRARITGTTPLECWTASGRSKTKKNNNKKRKDCPPRRQQRPRALPKKKKKRQLGSRGMPVDGG